MNQRFLTQEEEKQLELLNNAVLIAIQNRREWLDKKMVETSEIKVGDDIFDLNTGRRLGVVTSLYRFWRDRDDGIRDRSVSCDYEYCEGGNCHNNTSSQRGLHFGSRDKAAKYASNTLESLLRNAK